MAKPSKFEPMIFKQRARSRTNHPEPDPLGFLQSATGQTCPIPVNREFQRKHPEARAVQRGRKMPRVIGSGAPIAPRPAMGFERPDKVFGCEAHVVIAVAVANISDKCTASNGCATKSQPQQTPIKKLFSKRSGKSNGMTR